MYIGDFFLYVYFIIYLLFKLSYLFICLLSWLLGSILCIVTLFDGKQNNGNKFCLKKKSKLPEKNTEKNNLAPLKKKTSNWWLSAKKPPLHTTTPASTIQ